MSRKENNEGNVSKVTNFNYYTLKLNKNSSIMSYYMSSIQTVVV